MAPQKHEQQLLAVLRHGRESGIAPTECPQWGFCFHQTSGLEMGIWMPVGALCLGSLHCLRECDLPQAVLEEDCFFSLLLAFTPSGFLKMPDNPPHFPVFVFSSSSSWRGGISELSWVVLDGAGWTPFTPITGLLLRVRGSKIGALPVKPDEVTKQPQVFSVWGGSSASVGVSSFFKGSCW